MVQVIELRAREATRRGYWPRGVLRRGLCGVAMAAAISPAYAVLLEMQFKDPKGTVKTVSAGQRYVNPVGEINFAVSGGLSRSVRVTLQKEQSGLPVGSAQSGVLGADSTISVGGQTYYGAVLKAKAPVDGDYAARVEILTPNGQVVQTDMYPLVVDTLPPTTAGTISVRWNHGTSGSVAQFGTGSYEMIQGLTLDQITDASGLESARYFTVSKADGVRRETQATLDESRGVVSVLTSVAAGTKVTPINRSHYTLGFVVKDKAGNEATFSRDSAIDNELPPYWLEVFDSRQSRWVPNVAGTVVYENPARVRWKFRKSDHVAYNGSEYGWKEVYANNDDATFVYHEESVPLPAPDIYYGYPATNSGLFFPAWFTAFNGLSLGPGVELAPKGIKAMMQRDGGAWEEEKTTPGRPDYSNRPWAITGVRFFAEPRSYDQRAQIFFDSNPLGCVIPAGQPYCEIRTNVRYTSGFGYNPSAWVIAKADGSMQSFAGYLRHYWDFNPPIVDQVVVDPAVGEVRYRTTDGDSTNDWRYYMWTTSIFRASLQATDGKVYQLPRKATIENAYNTWTTTFNLAGPPDGLYTLTAEAEDNYGNAGRATYPQKVVLDRTAPTVSVSFANPQAVRTLDEILITVWDALDSAPRLQSIELSGGPTDRTVSMAWRSLGQGSANERKFGLEYAALAPSFGNPKPYRLTIKAVDASGNIGSRVVTFNYAPDEVPLQNDRKQPVRIPAIKARNDIFQERLQSDPIRLPDKSMVAGVYPIYATLHVDSTSPMTVGGLTVLPGETKLIDPSYDFGAHGGRYALVVSAATDAATAGGTATLVISTAAPNAPVGVATVTFWDPAEEVGVATSDGKSDYVVGLESYRMKAALKPQFTDCQGTAYVIAQGSVDDPAFQQSKLGALAPGKSLCAVRLNEASGAMDPLFSSFVGLLKSDGPYDLSYDAGLLYRDPESGAVSFFPSVTSSTFQLLGVGIEKAKPEVRFSPETALVQLGSSIDNPLTFVGNVIAGRLAVVGRFPGLVVKTNDGEAVKAPNGQTVARQVTTSVSRLWEKGPYRISYWYEAVPEHVWTSDLSMLAVPTTVAIYTAPIREKRITTEDVQINGQIGNIVGGKFVYDPNRMGEWRISVYQKIVRYEGNRAVVSLEARTAAPVATEADGSFAINIGRLAAGGNAVFVEAELVRDGVLTGRKVKGFDTPIGVANGEAIPAVLKNMRDDSGLVGGKTAYRPVIGSYIDSKRTADIGVLRWYASRDKGGTWNLVQESRQTGYTPVITEAGTYMFRASVINKHSGATFETNTITVDAFVRPDISIEMPRAGFINRPVTVHALSTVDNTAFTWSIKGPAKDAEAETYTGKSATFTPRAAGVYKVTVSGRTADEQTIENPLRVRTASGSFRVVPLQIPAPIVRGPAVVETGKRYTFTVQQGTPFTSTETTNERILGAWLMPDGKEIAGFEAVEYTVRPGDTEVRFQSWVEGQRDDSIRAGSFRLRPWTYQFPAMRMTMTKFDMRVPARANFSIGYVTAADVAKTGGEKFTFEWALPRGAAIASQSGNAIGVDFTEPGDQSVSVTVADGRGNEQTLRSDTLAVLPPTDLKASLALTVGDKWQRAPDKVQAKVTVDQLPKNDVVAKIEYLVDGEVVLTTTNSLTPAVLDIAAAGEHTVLARVISRGGAVVTPANQVTLISGTPPVCKIEASGSPSTTLQLTARCSIEKGRITGLRWLFDGKPTSITSSQALFNPKTIADVNQVQVVATSDKGQTGTASWSK